MLDPKVHPFELRTANMSSPGRRKRPRKRTIYASLTASSAAIHFRLRSTAPRMFVPAVVLLATCEKTLLELVGWEMETIQELFRYDR
jgi:hypothetical protein